MEISDLAKQEIRSWAIQKGPGHFRRTCPDCSASRRNFRSECLSVTVDNEKALFQCHHCEMSGGVRLEAPRPADRPAARSTTKAIKQVGDGIDPAVSAWLKGRGLSEATAKAYGVAWAHSYFPELRRETAAVAFPYYENGKVYGHKARSLEEKTHVCLPALHSLFGIQLVDMEASQDFIIAEGEPDALSLKEAGVLNATSVPNGSSSFARTQDPANEKAAYGFLWGAKGHIDKAKRIIICTDNDEPGEKLAEELARRIGRHRCYQVKYPDGCKDANDVLLKKGPAILKRIVADATPWPVEGLYEASKYFGDVLELFDKGYGDRVLTGLTPVDALYSVGKGLLTVVTGVPGNGKSTFVDQLMINLSRMYDHTFAVCSFEKPPREHIAQLSEMLVQKHFFKGDKPGDIMRKEELERAMVYIDRHFKFLQHDDKKATLESIIERIKTAVFRWGVRGAVVDPYNYIQRPKNAESETQWIDDLLTQLRLLAQAYDLHIWFIAHPTKLQQDADGGYTPPRGYSISGSAAWYSKADFGLTVHKVDKNGGAVKIINWKTRWTWLGKEDEVTICYDTSKNVYLADAFNDIHPLGSEALNYRGYRQ